MDDRRFDSLVKSFANGASRRSVLKGILGLGGAAIVGGTLLEGDADAARRPTPTPTPVKCPGMQVPVGGVCTCPGGLSKCGPTCCSPTVAVGTPGHTECCDNACCDGRCYGEELCCQYPLVFCEAQNECCQAGDNQCCGSMGCCDHACCPTSAGNQCCEGATPKCCGGDTCIPADGCCDDSECGGGCKSCINHICVDDRSKCPGGVGGCDECQGGVCVANNGRCDDGQACNDDICDAGTGTCSHPFDCNGQNSCCTGGNQCTSHTCLENGTCDYSSNCNGLSACCEDSNPCTQNICNSNGTCSNPFYCTSDSCCAGNANGPACNEDTGQCYNPCVSTEFADCGPGCCTGLTCVEVPAVGDFCFSCIPSYFEGIPVPCIGFCDLCCKYDYLGFCVDCNPPGNSCQGNANSCCDGLCCQYNPLGDNFCSPVCI